MMWKGIPDLMIMQTRYIWTFQTVQVSHADCDWSPPAKCGNAETVDTQSQCGDTVHVFNRLSWVTEFAQKNNNSRDAESCVRGLKRELNRVHSDLRRTNVKNWRRDQRRQRWDQSPSTGFRHPSITAVFSYAIGSRKLSANEQFFVGAQTVVSLLQTTHIIPSVCFKTDHVAYASSNKTKIVWIETELSFLPGVDASHVYVRAWALGCFHSHISTQTFWRELTASVDSCAEIKSGPSGRVWRKVPESDARSVRWDSQWPSKQGSSNFERVLHRKRVHTRQYRARLPCW